MPKLECKRQKMNFVRKVCKKEYGKGHIKYKYCYERKTCYKNYWLSK